MPDRARQDQREWPVARVSEIRPGGRKVVEVEGRSIGVFNVHGTFVAVLNVCPHELAPVCLGAVRGTALVSLPGEYDWGRERSEEHTSELQSRLHLVCRLLLEKKKIKRVNIV